ncbi:SMI1/KNR4 family protein [Priestia taiwanensis]|uniref:Knr4/Smi1-like domain-containing protein n=1 Tax=Priestia taiwanensis TaxID=1347902 RepID=A0A917ERW1_9BACI|nr:SMI1/KNR4 family protein [Priestia taiwanensis]MBM7364098.1 hypothetical protein [Priestia taiwanensis]GGE71586.1 hypothetical protein GCM10007140_21910 [Priestia taiwanensis]
MRELIRKWQNTIQKVAGLGGDTQFFVDDVASIVEVEEIEKSLQITLPKEFREALLTLSKEVNLYWKLPYDKTLPEPLEDIVDGELKWDIHELVELNEGYPLKGMIVFSLLSLGDRLAIDVTHRPGAVVYWMDGDEEAVYLADTFAIYLETITALHFVNVDDLGHENFMGEARLSLHTPYSKAWMEWFEYPLPQKAESEIEQLLAMVLRYGGKGKGDSSILHNIPKEELFEAMTNRLIRGDKYEQVVLSRVLVKLFGSDAAKWIRSLWQEETSIHIHIRSYLTAKCLPHAEGLLLVLTFLEQQNLDGSEVFYHLQHFHSPLIVEWMEDKVKLPVDGWAALFARCNPEWSVMKKWMYMERHHSDILLHTFRYMMEEGRLHITGLPEKEVFIAFWTNYKENGKWKRKFHMIDEIIYGVNRFYEDVKGMNNESNRDI